MSFVIAKFVLSITVFYLIPKGFNIYRKSVVCFNPTPDGVGYSNALCYKYMKPTVSKMNITFCP